MRALLIVLDGLVAGNGPDAAEGTLAHALAAAPEVELPFLTRLGLGEILRGRVFDPPARRCEACYGRMRQRSTGKDCVSGHWEMAGSIVEQPFASFDTFPEGLLAAIGAEAGVEFLGNAPRTEEVALEEWGIEHLRTGKPIIFSSGRSVMEIAAHESVIPARRLHQICRVARRQCDDLRIRRVVAVPFGGDAGAWKVPSSRHEYAIVPPRTILNALSEMGHPVEGVGRTGEIFGRSGVTLSRSAHNNEEILRTVGSIWRTQQQNGLIYASLPDLETVYRRHRDPVGYARALERFDEWLERFMEEIESDDLLIVAGNQGDEPAFSGKNLKDEEAPVLVHYDGRTGPLGVRETYADVAGTLASFFGTGHWMSGSPLITFHRPHGFSVGR